MWRHHPQTQRLRELLDEGAIGRLRMVRASFSFPLADVGDIRMQAGLDGGALMDVGCYCVSGARLVAGAEPERVHGRAGRSAATASTSRSRRRCASPDDVLGAFDCGFAVRPRHQLEAIGEDGSLFLDDPWHGRSPRHRAAPRRTASSAIEVDAANPYALELDRLRAAPCAASAAAARARRRARAGARDRGALRLAAADVHERQEDRSVKTSLGIWALGPMVTRFVPGGYQPEHGARRPPRRCSAPSTGLGDLIDDYEFHYPGELSDGQPRRGPRGARRPRHLLHRHRPAPRPALRQGRARLARRRRAREARRAHASRPPTSPASSARTSSSGRGSRATTTRSRRPTARRWALADRGHRRGRRASARSTASSSSSSTRTPSPR